MLRFGGFRLGDIATVTDGIHASINFEEGTGIRVISAKHPKENYFDCDVCEEISRADHDANPRTALRVDDVIISTVGTIGNCAVVREDMLPANSDRHVGIIRLKQKVPSRFLSTFLLSRYGRFQTLRETTGNVQLNLFIGKICELLIPKLSNEFMAKVADTVHRADALRDTSREKQAQAEQTLLV